MFFYGMVMATSSALVLACLPGHYSPFLFSIGIFSAYLVVSGYRSLAYKRKVLSLRLDYFMSGTMAVTGLGMLLFPIIFYGQLNVILAAFGLTGLGFALRDFQLYRQRKKLRKAWLKLHLGKMIGGLAAATTAFVVVNDFFPPLVGWLLPGFLGGLVIAFWLRRLRKNPRKKAS